MSRGDDRRPLFARFYRWQSEKMEPHVGAHRAELLAGLSGAVIEVGAGNGLNFAHYPPEVTEILAVEPEPYLRGEASRAAAEAPIPVAVVAGRADRLPADDESSDAAVASLVLCSVDDQALALAELRRVLRPGGQLRFYEHVAADTPLTAWVQRAMDATVYPRLAGGCHASRDTVAAIERAGFDIEQLRRFSFPDCRAVPVHPHVIGRARR